MAELGTPRHRIDACHPWMDARSGPSPPLTNGHNSCRSQRKKLEVLESTFNDCPIFKLFEVGFDGMLSFILNWLGNDCRSNWVINDLPSTLRCQELMPRPIQEPRPDNEHRMAVVGSSSYKPNMWRLY